MGFGGGKAESFKGGNYLVGFFTVGREVEVFGAAEFVFEFDDDLLGVFLAEPGYSCEESKVIGGDGSDDVFAGANGEDAEGGFAADAGDANEELK